MASPGGVHFLPLELRVWGTPWLSKAANTRAHLCSSDFTNDPSPSLQHVCWVLCGVLAVPFSGSQWSGCGSYLFCVSFLQCSDLQDFPQKFQPLFQCWLVSPARGGRAATATLLESSLDPKCHKLILSLFLVAFLFVFNNMNTSLTFVHSFLLSKCL